MIGFLLLDKPAGPTSHDVVASVRRSLGVRRVGHAGTLDPPASGLLVIAVGPATRLLSYVQGAEKVYETTGLLGVRTSTLDAAGEVTGTADVACGREDLEAVLERFRGDIRQAPPAVSAVKILGERAYKRAARGEDVVPEPRTVTVHELELTDWAPPAFGLRVRCSTGTYVRSLVAGIGDALGCGAHVASLRRTRIGSLDVDDAIAVADVREEALRPPEEVLGLPVVRLGDEQVRLASNGRWVQHAVADGDVLVTGPAGAVGVFTSRDGILRPRTVLGTNPARGSASRPGEPSDP